MKITIQPYHHYRLQFHLMKSSKMQRINSCKDETRAESYCATPRIPPECIAGMESAFAEIFDPESD
jgi:hypothetical protein